MLAQLHELSQRQLDILLRANGVKRGFPFERPARPWEVDKPKRVQKERTAEEEAQFKADKERFYASLAERNRRRGVTEESVQSSIASKRRDV